MLAEWTKLAGAGGNDRPMTDDEYADMVDRLRALNLPDVKV